MPDMLPKAVKERAKAFRGRRVAAADDGPGGSIPNYLGLCVLTLIFCLPMGAAALVYSVRAEKYKQLEDYDAAQEAAYRARRISLIGLAIIGGAAAVYFLFMLLIMAVVR
jgi:hypothetical protein